MKCSPVVFSTALMVITGCASGTVGVKPADVDPAAVAANAMTACDANGDGALESSELAKCPALASTLALFDADADHRLSSAEISRKFETIKNSGTRSTGVQCTVTLDGKPLSGATVKLLPPDIFDGSLLPAEGVTDEQGIARPSIGADNLPEKLKTAALVYPGLYTVEITHPDQQLPERYNAKSELGLLIDPTSREGGGARFDLKSN